jgi:hypothetical protein
LDVVWRIGRSERIIDWMYAIRKYGVENDPKVFACSNWIVLPFQTLGKLYDVLRKISGAQV